MHTEQQAIQAAEAGVDIAALAAQYLGGPSARFGPEFDRRALTDIAGDVDPGTKRLKTDIELAFHG